MTDLSKMSGGGDHYRAYVGPPLQYDLVGATQFRLLTVLGLRGRHKLLDLGCGSLRAGRLFIPYLDPGNYFGIDPNAWLIEEGFRNELGLDILEIKRPRFDHNDQFDCSVFGERFDYVLAQSVFSHTAADAFIAGLKSAKEALAADGLIVATMVRPRDGAKWKRGHDASGWIYPTVCTYDQEALESVWSEAGVSARVIPWRHPRQVWFVAARKEKHLPSAKFDKHLSRVIRGDATFG